MIPSSQIRPVEYNAVDSCSICPSSAAVCARIASSSTSIPRPAAALRATISITPASCFGPITAMRWLGQEKMNRGL